MFYSQYVLAKKGPLGKIWLAAHMEKKVPKPQIMATDIPESVKSIENPSVPMALRVSGHLLLGVVRIFSRKVTYLLTDCSDAMLKLKDAFKVQGAVEMAPGASTRKHDDITNPENFDEMDLDTDMPSQAMDFTMNEDLMFGGEMSMPDEVPAFAADAFTAREPGLLQHVEEPEEGFGHNENWEEFFPNGSQAVEAAPAAKKRRSAEPEEPEEMPQEQFRSADDTSHTPAALEGNNVEMSREGHTVSSLGGGGFGEDPSGGSFIQGLADATMINDLPFMQNETPMPTPDQVGGIDDVMRDEFDVLRESGGRSSSRHAAADDSPVPARQQRPGKRKMLFDTKLQLSTEEMREQLADTASIVRQLGSQSNISSAEAQGASDDHLLSLSRLPNIPPEILELAKTFMSTEGPVAKKPRQSNRETRASAAAAEEVAVPTPANEMPIEHLRSADLEMEEPLATPAPDGATYSSFGGGADAPTGGDLTFESLGALEEPVSVHIPQGATPPSFNASHGLPEGDEHDDKANDPAKSSQGPATDQAAWSMRTKNMYEMLLVAFEESGGVALSYNAMVAKTRQTNLKKRRVVAGCFQELLYLSTHGFIEISQRTSFGDIIISKGDQLHVPECDI